MSDPWYRRFPDNFLGGINGMTLEEKGAYGVVIDMIYQRGGPIADEPRYIAGICNCSVRKWNAIRQRLIDLGKLYLVDGHLMNERAGIELEKSAKVAREHAENGSKGGDKSAENRAEARKINALGQARLKHTRASSTSTPFIEGGASLSGPTERLELVDRLIHGELFDACVSLLPDEQKPPKFLTHKSFPASLVAKAEAMLEETARQAMAEQSNSGAVH